MRQGALLAPGTHFTGFTGTKVQILTQKALQIEFCPPLKTHFKAVARDFSLAMHMHRHATKVLKLLALLVKKYKY